MAKVRCGLIMAMSILVATSCVRQPGPPPIGRGVFALDGALIFEEFAKSCQDAESPWHAEFAIRGSIHGHGIIEHARAGFAGASARIELGSPNTEPHVVFATRGGEGHSTLLLSDMSRVIKDQAFEVVLERVFWRQGRRSHLESDSARVSSPAAGRRHHGVWRTLAANFRRQKWKRVSLPGFVF
jgi:hypothetical protein